MDSTLMDAYKFRGSLYAQAGQLEPALADLKKYLTSDPENVGVWNNVAMIHMRLNQLPEALNAFNKTIELKPDVPISYQNRAKVYEMMGNKLSAQEDIQKAISLSGKRKQQ
jgi:Tfp pilus assembly protein PilF